MTRITFACALTTFEIREPVIETFEELAAERNLYAVFRQPQQQAFKKDRNGTHRIGNGKHKDWFMNIQADHPSTNRPTLLAQTAIRSFFDPSLKQFGGFIYPAWDESDLLHTYNYIDVSANHSHWPSLDQEFNEEIAQLGAQALEKVFETIKPRLF